MKHPLALCLLIYIGRMHDITHLLLILDMLAELIRGIVCKIEHCCLVQCKIGSIPVYSI